MGGKGSGVPKFTADAAAEVLRNLRAGAFKRHAAEAARVHYNTLDQWLRWGAEGREPYVKFAEDVTQAIAEDAVRNQAIITKAAHGPHDGDWKAAAWNLVKKHPKLYGELARGHELPSRERPFSPWGGTAAQPVAEPPPPETN